MKGLVLTAEWKPKSDYKLTEFEKKKGCAITGSSVWKNPKLQIKDLPEPSPKPDEVLIRVKACGVCGSDMHFYETDKEGYILYPGLTKFPCVLGHEFSGEVVEVGKGVKDLKPGDMVCAEEMIWCGRCKPCRDGYPNQCENLEEIGFTINGAFAEYIAIGAKYCWKIDALAEKYQSKDLGFSAGACVEPTSVAYNGIFECAGGFKPGANVVVYGAGPIGLAAIALSRAAGAAKIIAFEVSGGRRKLAKKMGADYVFDPVSLEKKGISLADQILEKTSGLGADMHIEAAGAPTKTIPEMEKSLSIGGKIVQIGRAAEKVPMYLEVLQVKKAKVYGAQGHSGYGTFPNVIRLMASGRINPLPMITSYFPLNSAIDAIAKSTSRNDGKIIVKV